MVEPYDDGRVCNIYHLLGLEVKEQEWLVKDLIPLKVIIYLAGDSGVGKSLLMLFLLLCSITNRKVFGEYEVERKVNILLIDVENRKEHLALRFKKIVNGNEMKIPGDVEFYISYGHNVSLNEDTIKKIEKMVVKHNINLIVLDSLIRFVDGNENSSQDARKVFEMLNPIVNNNNASLLILHHTIKRGKGEKDDMRGSGEFSASADIVYTLSQKRVSNKDLKVLKQVKNRNAKPIEPIAYELVNDDNDFQNGVIKFVRDTTYQEFAKKDLKEQMEDATTIWLNSLDKKKFTSKEYKVFLKKESGKEYTKYNEILNKFEDFGFIRRIKNGHYEKL